MVEIIFRLERAKLLDYLGLALGTHLDRLQSELDDTSETAQAEIEELRAELEDRDSLGDYEDDWER